MGVWEISTCLAGFISFFTNLIDFLFWDGSLFFFPFNYQWVECKCAFLSVDFLLSFFPCSFNIAFFWCWVSPFLLYLWCCVFLFSFVLTLELEILCGLLLGFFYFLFSSTVWEFWIGRFWFRLVIRKLTISEISLLWVFVYLNIWCVLTEILLVWLIGFPFLLSPLNFFLFWKFPSKKQMHLSIDHHNVLERFSNLGGVKLF